MPPTVLTSYALSLLSEYTHTLDSLPIDISRNFADLRELDAVLSSSIHSITTKIHNLTTMIEEDTASKEDRLWLLTEIAEDAQRLKLGGEDKIRVACQAADNLKAHSGHLRTLTDNIPGFDSSVLDRKTEYPHVSERAYKPALSMETGRRRRGGLGSIMVASNPDPSPAKRKRVGARDDDVDIHQRSPKKPIHGESNARGRTNGRAKKTDRGASPSESLVSITSHMPPQLTHSTSGRGGGASTAANNRGSGSGAGANTKRRAGANNQANTNATNRSTPLVNETYPAQHDQPHTNGNSRRGAASSNAEAYNNVPPSASHPSLPQPYQNGNANGGHLGNGFDAHGIPHLPGAQDWNIPRAQQLEGPGMPVARSASIHSTAASVPVPASNAVDTTDAGDGDADGDGDGDDRRYCFCNGVSYGSMVGCDDDNCEREWFHLACVGLTVAPTPETKWFCETCLNKKTTKRAVRGGKRRTGGGRAAARS